MQGVPAWHKFKNHAAIHLLRWNKDFTASVWLALTSGLRNRSGGAEADPETYLAQAIRLTHQQTESFSNLIQEITTKFGVSEQQIWALLIDSACPTSTSIDLLSDAHDHILRLAADKDARGTALLHEKIRRHRKKQKKIAEYPRNVIDTLDASVNVTELVGDIARDIRYQALTAKELWPIFFRVLEKHGAAPSLTPDIDKKGNARERITYFVKGGERSMLDTTFEKKVSAVRSMLK